MSAFVRYQVITQLPRPTPPGPSALSPRLIRKSIARLFPRQPPAPCGGSGDLRLNHRANRAGSTGAAPTKRHKRRSAWSSPSVLWRWDATRMYAKFASTDLRQPPAQNQPDDKSPLAMGSRFQTRDKPGTGCQPPIADDALFFTRFPARFPPLSHRVASWAARRCWYRIVVRDERDPRPEFHRPPALPPPVSAGDVLTSFGVVIGLVEPTTSHGLGESGGVMQHGHAGDHHVHHSKA